MYTICLSQFSHHSGHYCSDQGEEKSYETNET